MASTLRPKIQAFLAGADLSAYQYRMVKFGADLKTVIICGANEQAEGILMNAPALGETAEVAVEGGAMLKCTGVVGLGVPLASGALGVAAVATTGQKALCVSQDSGVNGDVIAVIIDRHAAP